MSTVEDNQVISLLPSSNVSTPQMSRYKGCHFRCCLRRKTGSTLKDEEEKGENNEANTFPDSKSEINWEMGVCSRWCPGFVEV